MSLPRAPAPPGAWAHTGYRIPPLCAYSSERFAELVRTSCDGAVFDIGANMGGHFGTWQRASPTCIVHAFEPIAAMRERALTRPDVDAARVIWNTVGVSDKPCDAVEVAVYQAWALLPVGATTPSGRVPGIDPFSMRLITLDDYVRETGVVPGLIKLDVDGYELRVLRGATFLRHRPVPMHFEYSYLPTLQGDSVEEMCRLIYDYGYEAVALDGEYRCRSAEEMFSRHYPSETSYDILLLPRDGR